MLFYKFQYLYKFQTIIFLTTIIFFCFCASCEPEHQEAVDKFDKNKILYLAKIEAHNNFGFRPQKGGDYFFFYVKVTYPLANGKLKNDDITYSINLNNLEDLSNISGYDRPAEIAKIQERVRRNIVIYADSMNVALNGCRYIPIVYDPTFNPNNFEAYKQHIVITEDDFASDSLNFSTRNKTFKKYVSNESDLTGYYRFERLMASFYAHLKASN